MAEKKVTKKKEEKEVIEKSVIISPRMTEKSVVAQESRGVYVFNVEKGATKRAIMLAVKGKYKVTPVKVRTSSVPSKEKFFKGSWGTRGGGKKAYVYLKKGDKISVA